MAGQAVSTAVSQMHTLLVLTSGTNRVFRARFNIDPLYSSEYIFIFDITNHAPVFTQASPSPMPITELSGIRFRQPRVYVSGGMATHPSHHPIPYTNEQ